MEHQQNCSCYDCWVERIRKNNMKDEMITITDGREQVGMSTMGIKAGDFV